MQSLYDWSLAGKDTEWLATDADGWVFEYPKGEAPKINESGGIWMLDKQIALPSFQGTAAFVDWRQSLERRPVYV